MSNDSANIEDGIAVIGLAGRFPGAPNLDIFWRNLKAGVESISHFTEQELEVPRPVDKDSHFVPARAILPEVDLFDADFFSMQPREAEYTDPQHRLLLETAWEALENAGCDPAQIEGTVGVFAGCSQNTYLLHNLASNPAFLAEYLASQQMGAHPALLGNDKDFLATRVSYKLNLHGPSVAVQSACSTSLVAICQACQSLLTFQCDLALAGGVSVTFPQKRGYVYEEGSIVSKDGRCRPFDAAADGTVFGDGVGLVALKRADEAMRDGDHIYAIIRGFAVNNDGSDKVSYMAPSVEGQYQAIGRGAGARRSRYSDHSLRRGPRHRHIAGRSDRSRRADQGVSNRHLRAAILRAWCAQGKCRPHGIRGGRRRAHQGGVGGLSRRDSAHAQFSKPNPQIDFEKTPFYVSSELKPWPVLAAPRRAGVSSFGVGGTNAHLVLEQAPPVTRLAHQPSPQLLVLSAKTESALEAAAARLADYLRSHPEAPLSDIAFTLQTGRRAFHCRRAFVSQTATEAVGILDRKLPLPTGNTRGRKTGIAFLFPGQGAQQVGMGRDLYENEPVFRAEVDRCCELLKPELRLDLREILYPAKPAPEAEALLTQTALTQPALFVIEYALAQVWLARGVKPQAMVGHSLGEYVAAVLAGIFTLQDALHLLAVRGRLMQALPSGVMLAVAMPEKELAPLLGEKLAIAGVNGPRSCVVSGPKDAAAALNKRLSDEGIACRELKTSHAFHSIMMDPILAEFESEVRKVTRNAPKIPIISTLYGRLATNNEWTDPSYWSKQLRQTVRFADALGAILSEENLVFLEVGPGQTLSALARQHSRGNKIR